MGGGQWAVGGRPEPSGGRREAEDRRRAAGTRVGSSFSWILRLSVFHNAPCRGVVPHLPSRALRFARQAARHRVGVPDLDRAIRLLLPTAVTPARYAAHGARDRHPRFVRVVPTSVVARSPTREMIHKKKAVS